MYDDHSLCPFRSNKGNYVEESSLIKTQSTLIESVKCGKILWLISSGERKKYPVL